MVYLLQRELLGGFVVKQNKAVQEDIKSVNKKLVFRTIINESPISRAEIKRKQSFLLQQFQL